MLECFKFQKTFSTEKIIMKKRKSLNHSHYVITLSSMKY